MENALSGIRTCAPPSAEVRARIEARLAEGLAIVRAKPNFSEFPEPRLVYFNQRAAAGCALPGPWVIALNRGLFERYLEENLHETVFHELAHLVIAHGKRLRLVSSRAKSHGAEWQSVMKRWFGVAPERTHNQPVDHLPIRRQARWRYQCKCQTYEITTVRHNKVRRKTAVYHCRDCRGELVYVGSAAH